MNHAMEIQLKPTEGALLRTLGLIECRGFRLENVNLQSPVAGHHQLSLVLHSPDRNIDVLKRQIMRLIDVVSVTIKASEASFLKTPSTMVQPGIVSEVSSWAG